MKKAVIEIGTNSVKFCLASDMGGGKFSVIKDVSVITKMGRGLKENGMICGSSFECSAEVISGFVKEARESGVSEIAIAGTMVMRTAKNAHDFAEYIKKITGTELTILSGDEEAQLSYIAVISGSADTADADFTIFDTGGGSTELIFCKNGIPDRKVSVDVGAIRFTEQYLSRTPVDPLSLIKAQAEIYSELSKEIRLPAGDFLIGIGGNVTSMAAVGQKMRVYDAGVIQGSVIALTEVERQISDYAAKTIGERRKITGLPAERADVILAGACIVRAVMELCRLPELTVSDRGLRHGLMYGLFGGGSPG